MNTRGRKQPASAWKWRDCSPKTGAHVVLMGREKGKRATAVAQIGELASAAAVDITDLGALASALHMAEERLGSIDILFANAGMSEAPFIEATTEADFDRLMNLNVKPESSPWVYALPALRDGASIVLTGSVAGTQRTAGRCHLCSEQRRDPQLRTNSRGR